MEQNRAMLQDLQGKVYHMLDTTCPGSFDDEHIRLVEKYCVELALRRGLDPTIAQMMALLHDHGRVMGNVAGKEHAPAGAEIALEWLKPYDLEDVVINTIQNAIKVHNQKKKLHGPYEELLKDGDVLAHKDAFGDDLPKYEKVRLKDIGMQPLTIALNGDLQVQEVFESHMKRLNQKMKKLSEEGITNKAVHQYRIQVRKLRALLWVTKQDHWNESGKKLNRRLKRSFKDYEYVRQLAVFHKTLMKLHISEELCEAIDHDIVMHKVKVREKINKRRKAIKDVTAPQLELTEELLQSKLDGYRTLLFTTDPQDIGALHELRIYGKKLKYLIEEGVLLVSEDGDYTMINQLHELIGQLNDIRENRHLIMDLSRKSEFDELQEYANTLNHYMDEHENKLAKDIQVILFRMKKRWLA